MFKVNIKLWSKLNEIICKNTLFVTNKNSTILHIVIWSGLKVIVDRNSNQLSAGLIKKLHKLPHLQLIFLGVGGLHKIGFK